MNLIVTLGTTPANHKHKYNIKNKQYEEIFSFLALKKAFNIDDINVYIMGTKQTKDKHSSLIKNYHFIEVDETNLNEIFGKSIELFKDESIVDLTQSFRSLSFGTLLGFSFSQIDNNVKNIYYAQVKDNCNPSVNICEFDFISLKEYEEAIELARKINTFTNSWYVIRGKQKDFKPIENNIAIISRKLLVNNLDVSNNIDNILTEIDKVEKDRFDYLSKHLSELKNEILGLENVLTLHNEGDKFFNIARLYFKKNLLLQTLTMLFEAVNIYIADIYWEERCKNKKGEFTKDEPYKFRNCVKNKFLGNRKKEDCYREWNGKIKNCKKFRQYFLKIDEIRNSSAHAFIEDDKYKDYKNEINMFINFFQNYFETIDSDEVTK
jgi:hypothetical protein